MDEIPQVKESFTNRYKVFYPNVREILFKKGELYTNLGKFVAETNRENDSFLVPDDFDLRGVYIYQQFANPNKAYRIYKEFAEYNFHGYDDDKLIHNLQNVQANIKLTEFPYGVVTLEGMIIGQEIPYYPQYQTLYKYIVNEPDKRKIILIYKKIIMLLKELYDNKVIYTDIHAKNFMVKNDDVKLIDFENSQIRFGKNEYYVTNMFDSLIGMINLYIGIDYDIRKIYNFDDILEKVDTLKRIV